MAFTASNSSRGTNSRSAIIRSMRPFIIVSISALKAWAAPAALVRNRAIPSRKGFSVCMAITFLAFVEARLQSKRGEARSPLLDTISPLRELVAADQARFIHDRGRPSIPQYRSGADPYLRPNQHPLVRLVVHRRTPAWVVVCAEAAAEQGAVGGTAVPGQAARDSRRHRRSLCLDHARRDHRRAARLRPVLRRALLRVCRRCG